MKDTKQYFPVVLFIMLYKVLLTFESVNEILISVRIQTNGTFLQLCYHAIQVRSNF